MTIKAVLFDADGVVINPAMQFAKYLLTTHGITPEMTRPFFNGVFIDCLLGKADLKAVLPPFLAEWQWHASVDVFVDTWMAEDGHADQHVINAVQRLRSMGLVCGLATLQEHHRAGYMKTAMNFNELFDRTFFSCELGCMKPDEAFYRQIEQALHLPGREILFWDDSVKNVITARKLGWHAEVYLSFQDFEERMPQYT